MFGLGMFFDIGWMKAVSGAYMAALWLPFTPEKIITCNCFGFASLDIPKGQKNRRAD